MKCRNNLLLGIILLLFGSFFVADSYAEDVIITVVTTEEELVTAITTGGYIQLGADISLTSTLKINQTTTLDLNGYMLKQTKQLTVINGTGLNSKTLTIKDSRPNENIHYFIKSDTSQWIYTENPEGDYETITGGIITGGYNKSDISSSGGGALKMNDAKDYVVIEGGTIVGNYAARAGGASYGGAVTMNGGRICGNAAGKFAGAIALSGNFTMNNGVIEKNYSPSGDNVYDFYITDLSIGQTSNFTITGGIIRANIATVNTTSRSTLTISEDALIDGNIYLQSGITAKITGGKVNGRIRMTKGSCTMSGGEITGGVADDSEINYYGTNGGALSIEGGNFTMSGGSIYNNTASLNGGGVYVNGGTFIMNGGSIYSNESPNGGGVYVNSGDATITGGNIGLNEKGNKANTGNGGGIYVAGGNVNITGGNVSSNQTLNGNGGGLYLQGGAFTMSSGNINNNSSINGAGAYIIDTTFELTGGIFENNIATKNGGGFFIGDNSNVSLSNGEVRNNKAQNGSGFYQTEEENDSKTELKGNCIVTNNEAINGNGAGVYIDGGSTFRMIGGKVTYNKATTASTLNLMGAKDSTSGVGGGVYILNGTFTMYDELDNPGTAAIFGNTADYAADDLFASGDNTSFDAISVINMEKADAYKTADSWFEDFPLGESHTTLNYEKRNDNDNTNDTLESLGRYKDMTESEDKKVATTVLHRNCTDYIAITMGNSVGKIRLSVLGDNVIKSHTFIYKIESCKDEECNDTESDIEIEVVAQKNKDAIIVDMPTGIYKVTIIPTWSWRYSENVNFEVIENDVKKDKLTNKSVTVNVYSEQFTKVNTTYNFLDKHWICQTFIK